MKYSNLTFVIIFMALLPEINAGGGTSKPAVMTKNEIDLTEKAKELQRKKGKHKEFKLKERLKVSLYLEHAQIEEKDHYRFFLDEKLETLYLSECDFINKTGTAAEGDLFTNHCKIVLSLLKGNQEVQQKIAYTYNIEIALTVLPTTKASTKKQRVFIKENCDEYALSRNSLYNLEMQARQISTK